MKKFWPLLLLMSLVACQPSPAITTPTHISTPFATPTLAAVRYELRQPEPDELLRMIDSALQAEQEFEYKENVSSRILEREPASLHWLIGADFERYHLNGFPNAENFVTQDSLPWQLISFGDLNSFSVVLRIALLQYINQHQDLLENSQSLVLPNATIKTYSIDLDGDTKLEWLVSVEYPEYSLQNWILIRRHEDGLYYALPSFNYDLAVTQDFTHNIEIRDLTGDGNPEIIKVKQYYLAGGIHGDISVYTWKDNHLTFAKSIDLLGVPPVYGETYASEYKIDDFNKDGVAELRVDTPQFRRFGCQWMRSSIYYFDGRVPDVDISGAEIPLTSECLTARAWESENAIDRARLYEEALKAFDAKISPSDKLAWTKLQLAMTYTALGDDLRATAQIHDLLETQNDGKFLKFVQKTYAEENPPSPLVLCDELHSAIASQDITGSLGSEIDIDLMHGAYPIDFAPVADLVCPFPQVLAERLENSDIPISQSPIDTLTASGYSFTKTLTLNWDSDAEEEWLGILNFHQPMLVLMNGDKTWNIDVVEIHVSDIQAFEANLFIPELNAAPKILVLFSGTGRFCSAPDTTKLLVEINPDMMERISYYLCDSNSYSLAKESDIRKARDAFSAAYSFEPIDMPDWFYIPDPALEDYEQPTILNILSDMEFEILNQSNFEESSSELSQLIKSLPADDPAAQILLGRLHYLQGLNYELSGQDEIAVETYLKLIELSPDSLWAQYAQLRIQQVP